MKRKTRNQYPNMAKWIKNYEMAEKCTALFFHCFFIWEGSALLYLPTQKTNKKSLLLSEFVYNWYQFYIYIYIYRERERERERERYLYGSTFGKSTFLESRSFRVWPWIRQFSLIKNFFALICFFFFNWEKPWVPYN